MFSVWQVSLAAGSQLRTCVRGDPHLLRTDTATQHSAVQHLISRSTKEAPSYERQERGRTLRYTTQARDTYPVDTRNGTPLRDVAIQHCRNTMSSNTAKQPHDGLCLATIHVAVRLKSLVFAEGALTAPHGHKPDLSPATYDTQS
ncbi:hypothetical protein SVAN01_11765 [Stagonosporopsis vannaccii]|nr:hypothetical protein SVAN01_11765 [Stagonosporopsis vannaccii]